MNRGVAGWWVVALTVVGMLIASTVLAPALTGGPQRGPVPTPPPAGSCLSRVGSSYVLADCAAPHGLEVVAAWSAGLGRPAGKDAYSSCAVAAAGYVGDLSQTVPTAAASPGWRPPPLAYAIDLAHGPGIDLIPGYSWQLCLVRPTVSYRPVEPFSGSIRGIDTTSDRPVMLRSCYSQPDSPASAVPCGRPHLGELLATQNVRVSQETDLAADPGLGAQCRSIAQRRTGAADPTFGGRVAITVGATQYGMGWNTTDVTGQTGDGGQTTYVAYHVNCALQITGESRLTASMIGIGTAPLPLTDGG